MTVAMLAGGHRANAAKRVLARQPEVSVQDFAHYPSLITPIEDFFVRNHFDVPAATASVWKIQVKGLLREPGYIGAGETLGSGGSSIRSVLECAGNGVGVGAVGCAEWTGIRIGELLARFGVQPSVRFVRFVGADSGHEPDAGPGPLRYSRVLPIDQVLGSDAMLVGGMNGQALAAEHGGPVRALFPGRYGMDSVKWLSEVELLEERPADFFMTHRFRRVQAGGPGEAIGTMLPKSIIVKPGAGSAFRGNQVTAGGYAWSGRPKIRTVHVRLDGGHWMPVRWLSTPERYSFTGWAVELSNIGPGAHTLESRAEDAAGMLQPERRDAGRQDEYELNQLQRTPFSIRP